MSDWPADVERVSAFLRESGAEGRIEEFDVETATAADAAKAVGCEIGAIVKSLVVLCDDRAVVALVPGDRRGDIAKIAARGRRKRGPRRAPARGAESTGFAPAPSRRFRSNGSSAC